MTAGAGAIARKWRMLTEPPWPATVAQVPVDELRALCLAVLGVPPPPASTPGDGGFPVRPVDTANMARQCTLCRRIVRVIDGADVAHDHATPCAVAVRAGASDADELQWDSPGKRVRDAHVTVRR